MTVQVVWERIVGSPTGGRRSPAQIARPAPTKPRARMIATSETETGRRSSSAAVSRSWTSSSVLVSAPMAASKRLW